MRLRRRFVVSSSTADFQNRPYQNAAAHIRTQSVHEAGGVYLWALGSQRAVHRRLSFPSVGALNSRARHLRPILPADAQDGGTCQRTLERTEPSHRPSRGSGIPVNAGRGAIPSISCPMAGNDGPDPGHRSQNNRSSCQSPRRTAYPDRRSGGAKRRIPYRRTKRSLHRRSATES